MAQYRCKRRTMLPDGRLAKVGEIYDLKEAPPSDYTWQALPTLEVHKEQADHEAPEATLQTEALPDESLPDEELPDEPLQSEESQEDLPTQNEEKENA